MLKDTYFVCIFTSLEVSVLFCFLLAFGGIQSIPLIIKLSYSYVVVYLV